MAKYVKGCFYCDHGPDFQDMFYYVCDLKISSVFLAKDQTYRGRSSCMFKPAHYDELYEIPPEQMHEFMDDVAAVAETLKELYQAKKINYAVYGDVVSHFHFNLVPKYPDSPGFGGPFELNPKEKVLLSEEEYRRVIGEISALARRKRGLEL